MNNRDQISHLIGVLTRDFVNSRSPHAKKGGLIGLASVAIGLRDVRMLTYRGLCSYMSRLKKQSFQSPDPLNSIPFQMSRFFVEPLVRPIMVQLEDTDNNVRFYACESLYNVIKVNLA